MQARDATGRKVSLLNDDSSSPMERVHHHQHHQLNYHGHDQHNHQNLSSQLQSPVHPPHQHQHHQQQQPQQYQLQHEQHPGQLLQQLQHLQQLHHQFLHHQTAHRSGSSPPATPELLRSNSYDSQMSTNPTSPLTPSVDHSYPSRTSSYSNVHDYRLEGQTAKRPVYNSRSRAASYEDESTASSVPERAAKRYPCRYRDSFGCEMTFTTSGHASRHSKIHTAEKAVECEFEGCDKKFTRHDNMKQHLGTHKKEKSRASSGQHRVQKSQSANGRRSSASTTRSRSSTIKKESLISSEPPEQRQKHHLPTSPLPSPLPPATRAASPVWEMRGLQLPPLKHSDGVNSAASNGLETLALAAARQESSSA